MDTTNTYFGTDEDTSDSGLLKRGHSKEGNPELPLVSIAFAITGDGIPLRCWVFPGNASDQTIVEQVKSDLGQWNLGHVVMVQDAGFNSADNRRILFRECGDYIIGEKLRVGTDGAAVEALHRKGRFRILENGLAVKDVVVDAGKPRSVDSSSSRIRKPKRGTGLFAGRLSKPRNENLKNCRSIPGKPT